MWECKSICIIKKVKKKKKKKQGSLYKSAPSSNRAKGSKKDLWAYYTGSPVSLCQEIKKVNQDLQRFKQEPKPLFIRKKTKKH